jgi:hypothetical protein
MPLDWLLSFLSPVTVRALLPIVGHRRRVTSGPERAALGHLHRALVRRLDELEEQAA